MKKDHVVLENADEFSWRKDQSLAQTVYKKGYGNVEEKDLVIEDSIHRAFSKDAVLRIADNSEIDFYVKDGVVYIRGYMNNNTIRQRVEKVLQDVEGIHGSRNNLVIDDDLKNEVFELLGDLEQTDRSKILTSVSHGVVRLNGEVDSVEVSKKAERFAASHPKVRGVINHLRVAGVDLGVQDHRFLQPSIGAEVHFRDGAPGLVEKVVISPDTRRVVAMIVKVRAAEQLIVIPISLMGQLMKNSGILTIRSTDQTQVQEFDPGLFLAPNDNWVPPYPYCSEQVLFPVAYLQKGASAINLMDQSAFILKMKDQRLEEQLLANDSLGG